MLRKILDAHKGKLPEDVFVCFQNTGEEREETLAFVRDVSERWQVPVVWQEYRRLFNPAHYTEDLLVYSGHGPHSKHPDAAPKTVVVDFDTASRHAEPFRQLVEWMTAYRAFVKDKEPILPNPTRRICTNELKIKTLDRWMRERCEEYTAVQGIRADEPKRIANKGAKGTKADEVEMPLADAGVTKADVLAFWGWESDERGGYRSNGKGQGFDLGLDAGGDLGNCTLCFMKARGKVVGVMRDTDEFDSFWVWAEKATGQTFRKDRSYTDLRAKIAAGLPIKGVDEDAVGDCFCGPGD
jgi:3'-phosphoadenosine 5'-phosphosulfate sulfotransferase (PAPS reductase)/FAD synthetase